ncbi:MAG: long-chain fatty aldehyde decarbonylase [Bacilli bacterium]|nr:long-chain fatty aldehyde decarbonylase [Bacilli bacterium]
MDFQLNKPYPKPRVTCKNIEYAKILLQDYAGESGEDSAIHLYMFQNLILREQYPQIANNLFYISVIEMHHLKLLGETIELLGVTPEYITYEANSDNKIYWTSKNINYTTSICDILKLDIEKESHAIKEYQAHYQAITDPYIRELLLRIIEDEKVHLEYFEKQLLALKKENMD